MFHAEHTPIEVLAHLLIAALFLIVGVRNVLRWPEVIARMRGLKVPMPEVSFPVTLVVQFAGAGLVAADVQADIGALMLIVFTVTVTAFYHRFWTYGDARQRHVHFQFLCNNLAVVGGLLLLV